MSRYLPKADGSTILYLADDRAYELTRGQAKTQIEDMRRFGAVLRGPLGQAYLDMAHEIVVALAGAEQIRREQAYSGLCIVSES